MSISGKVERDKLAPLFQRKAVKCDYYMLSGSNLWLARGCILLSCMCNTCLDTVGVLRWQYCRKHSEGKPGSL